MAQAALRPCAQPGCAALTSTTRCPAHTRQRDSARGTATERGYGARWQRERLAFIRTQFEQGNVECAMCGKPFLSNRGIEVDHNVPHRGNYERMWDWGNWQMLCHRCHSAKTMGEINGR